MASLVAPAGDAVDADAILSVLGRIAEEESGAAALDRFVAEVVRYDGPALAKAGLYIALANWAIEAPSLWRTRLWESFATAGAGDILPKLTAALPEERARVLLASDPAALRKSLLPWLAEAYTQAGRSPRNLLVAPRARALRHADPASLRRFSAPDLANRVADWLTDPAKAIVEDVRHGASVVVGRIRDGVLSLSDVVSAVAVLAIDELTSFVRDVTATGVRIVDLLTEAVRRGVEELNRFVEATYAAVMRVNDLIEWLGANTGFMAPVVATLLRIGVAPLEIVATACAIATPVLGQIIVGVTEGVGGLVHFMAGIAIASAETLRAVVHQLIQLGHDLTSIVAATAASVADDLLRGQVFRAFIDAGVGIGDLVLAAARAEAGLCAAAVAGLICACGGKELSADQKKHARRVFGNWSHLDDVRIAYGKTLPNLLCEAFGQHRPYTTLYLLNFPGPSAATPAELIHELVHVWQNYEQGPGYIVNSLEARLRAGDSQAYQYDQRDLQKGKAWISFNVEQQASIIEDYFRKRYDPSATRDIAGLAPYLPYARIVYSPPEAFDADTSDERPRPTGGHSGSSYSDAYTRVERDKHGRLILHSLIHEMTRTHIERDR